MAKNIKLEFNGAITRLAGNPYGKKVYEEQVKNIFDFNDKNVIIFPNTIEDIAISFVQGFISEILEKIDRDMLFDHIEIEATEKVKDKFFKSVYY